MRDEKKCVLVKLELEEEPGTPEAASVSGSMSEASLHTASRSRRSARQIERSGAEAEKREDAPRAAAPAPSAVSVRFQFIAIDCRLLRFPAVVPLFPAVRYSITRSRFSGPLVAVLRSGSRQENHVLLSLRSGAACAAGCLFSPAAVRFAFRPHRPACPARVRGFRLSLSARSARLITGIGSSSEAVRRRRLKFPVHHPVPASCSARLLFVLFMVCISKFVFRFVQACFFRSSISCSSQFVLSFVLSLFCFVFACLYVRFIYLFPAYIIHSRGRKTNVFFIEIHVLF